jgi:hypothetical protein
MNPANPAHRRQAARLGFAWDSWLEASMLLRGCDFHATGFTGRLTNWVMRASLLPIHTDALKSAFKITFVGELTKQTAKSWDEITPA